MKSQKKVLEKNDTFDRMFSFFFWLCGSWAKAQNKESLIRLYSIHSWWSGWKKLQCRGLVPLYEGLEHGGSSIEEEVEQPAVVPSDW